MRGKDNFVKLLEESFNIDSENSNADINENKCGGYIHSEILHNDEECTTNVEFQLVCATISTILVKSIGMNEK